MILMDNLPGTLHNNSLQAVKEIHTDRGTFTGTFEVIVTIIVIT